VPAPAPAWRPPPDQRAPAATAHRSGGGSSPLLWAALGLAAIAGAAALVTSGQGAVLKESLINGPLGKSGFAAAFSLIFLSGGGLLADGRWPVAAGCWLLAAPAGDAERCSLRLEVPLRPSTPSGRMRAPAPGRRPRTCPPARPPALPP
jgi:hypothetical protein